MKKEKLIALLTVICMTATPVFAETGLKIAGDKKDDVIALKDLGISVKADHYTTIREDDDELVYIYTNEDESIPYIIIGQYEFTSDNFADDFTEYMNKQCDDLEETSRDSVTINGLEFDRVTYEYTVSGYDAKDTRLFHEMDDSTYMFGMKEVPELDYMVDYDYLEDVAGSMKPLKDKEYENYVDSEHDITEEKNSETEKIGKNTIEKKKDGDKVENREEKEVESIFDIPKKEKNKENDEENANEETIRFKKSMASYSGTWVPVEDQFQLYLPNTWNEFIPSDEQKELGTIYQAGDARAIDGENAPYISVNMGDAQGIDSMEALKEEMENDYDIHGFVDVNGIECLSYSYDDPNLSGMMFFYPDDPDYVLAVVGYNYDDFEDILGPVLCSISPL